LRRPSTLRLLFVAIWVNPMFRARGLTYPSGYRLIQQFPGGWSANRMDRSSMRQQNALATVYPWCPIINRSGTTARIRELADSVPRPFLCVIM
jgi:hypothetical protein